MVSPVDLPADKSYLRVAVEDAVLASFFIVDDELDAQLGAIGPLGVRRALAVPHKVAGVGQRVVGARCRHSRRRRHGC
jgi:hypothetical protein